MNPGEETKSVGPHPPDREQSGPNRSVAGRADRPREIGPYRILETLGEGGMGVVYLAEQTKPIHRRVALKIIKLGMDTKQVIARFETEREALALMNHANVARVFDAGATETGRPYFAMEYVPGIPITKYCDKHRLNTEERLRLFMDVCHAIQHAHQKGIIHRDIKPSNVLVAVQDEKPTPKVIDFGIAKATQQKLSELTFSTQEGQFIGTPAYMSPEQAGVMAADIDTRTDVYSLGVLLYELLVGSRPFDDELLRSAMLSEVQRIIREVEPPKPSTRLSSIGALSTTIAENRGTQFRTLARQLRGDLDWIVMKCLEKDRTRRYPSATELAAELQRFLAHQPVVAGPPSASYRVKKFVRRNKVMVAGVSAIIAALAIGLIISDLQRKRALRAEALAAERLTETEAALDQAETARGESEAVTQFLSETIASADPGKEGKDVTVREVIDRAAQTIGEKFKDKPLIQAKLQHTIGWTYLSLGLYQSAETHGAEAAALYRRTKGEDDPDTLGAMNTLATIIADRGDFSRSEARHRATLEVQRRVLGEEHRDTLSSMNNLAINLRDQGRYAEAEELDRKTLEVRRRVLGEEHPHTLASMNNLANIIFHQGRYAEAEELSRRTLEVRRRVLGEEHPDTLASMNNLANILFHQGRYAEAEELYRKTLEVLRRVLGEEHRDTLASMNNLAISLRNQGRYAEAEELSRRTLEVRCRVLGEEHPDTLASMGNLAISLFGQGRYADAEGLYRQTLEMHRRVLGEEHPDTLRCMNNLATSLNTQGRFAEAEEMYRKTLEVRRRVLGDEHPDTLTSVAGLAETLVSQDKPEEARPLFAELIAARRKAAEGSSSNALTQGALANLLLTCDLEELRDPTAALALAEKAVEAMGGQEPAILDTLALACFRTGAVDRAVETQRKALALLPPDRTTFRTTLEGKLGEYLTGQASWAEAESLLLGAHDALAKREHVPAKETKESRERLERLYQAWDAAEPGKGYAVKAAEWRARLETGDKKLETKR